MLKSALIRGIISAREYKCGFAEALVRSDVHTSSKNENEESLSVAYSLPRGIIDAI